MSARSNISLGFSQTIGVKPTCLPKENQKAQGLSKSFMDSRPQNNGIFGPQNQGPAGKKSGHRRAGSIWFNFQENQENQPDFWVKNKSPDPKIEKMTKRQPKASSGFSLKTDDISGAYSRSPRKSTGNRGLNVEDIKGTAPKSYRPLSARIVNPVEPEYHLPTFAQPEPEVPKFLRDQIDNSVKNSRLRK
jgi:hypothetical protein